MSETNYAEMTTAALHGVMARQQADGPAAIDESWRTLGIALTASGFGAVVLCTGFIIMLVLGAPLIGGLLCFVGLAVIVFGYVPWLVAIGNLRTLNDDMRQATSELEKRNKSPYRHREIWNE